MKQLVRQPKKALKLFIFTVAVIGLFAYYNETKKADFSGNKLPAVAGDPILTESGAQHILIGDKKSGGHKFGVGKPCKSEFPQDWDDAKILGTIKNIAANDNLPWQQQGNGYFVADEMLDGVKVQVVLSKDRTKIITGYPTNRQRNPCPPANDNFNE
jgi:filamentous hemagglutinin